MRQDIVTPHILVLVILLRVSPGVPFSQIPLLGGKRRVLRLLNSQAERNPASLGHSEERLPANPHAPSSPTPMCVGLERGHATTSWA